MASATDRAALCRPDHRPPALPAGSHAHHRLLGPCEVSLDHPDGVVAACQPQPPPDAPDRQVVHTTRLGHTGCPLATTEVLGFRSARPVATSEGLPAVHYSFWPTASSPPPPHPRSPGRTGHRLPNFNDQSSGRTHTSSSSELPGVHATRGRRRMAAPRPGGCENLPVPGRRRIRLGFPTVPARSAATVITPINRSGRQTREDEPPGRAEPSSPHRRTGTSRAPGRDRSTDVTRGATVRRP